MEAISTEDREKVSILLGREPRGLRAIPVRCLNGRPVVIQVASLVDNKPFPTLFWLVDKRLNYAIDQLEAQGLIAEFQALIDADSELQASMREDHHHYIRLRWSFIAPEERRDIERLGFVSALEQRGIGGIANFTRIRCLHTYYAAHLVRPNTVGRLLDAHWQRLGCVFDHITSPRVG